MKKRGLILLVICLYLFSTLPVSAGIFTKSNAEEPLVLYPIADTMIGDGSGNFRDLNYGNDASGFISGTINGSGYQRYLFMEYDFRGIEADFEKAELSLFSAWATNAAVPVGIFLLNDVEWSEYESTYSNTILGEENGQLREFLMNGNNCLLQMGLLTANSSITGDITDILKNALKEQEVITLVARVMSSASAPQANIHTREAEDMNLRPKIVVTPKTKEEPQEPVDPIENGQLVYPIEDASIRNGSGTEPTTNYGNVDEAYISGSFASLSGQNGGYMRHYIMKYNLGGLQRKVKKATLTLSTGPSGSVGDNNPYFGIFTTYNTDWNQETVTFRNMDVSFLSNLGDAFLLGQMNNNDTKTFDITPVITQMQLENKNAFTMGVKFLDSDRNTSSVFKNLYTNKIGDVAKRPHLQIEYYDDEEDYTLIHNRFSSFGAGISYTGLRNGRVAIQSRVASNVEGSASVIFALCRGDESSYRIVDLKEVPFIKSDTDYAVISHEVTVTDATKEFIKIFLWDSLEHQVIVKEGSTFR